MLNTNIRESSLNAHDYVQSSGKASTQENTILNFLRDNMHLSFTRRELAESLGMETSTMSARVNSLVKAGKLVELDHKRKCTVSKITAIALKLPTEQSELF